ncbi:phage tail tape measure protein [Streptomyces sp. NBC_01420]|uniref:phage tail tape measure protein n=1 Tax=Streptomyces sp. NBC_01420 TaxID=2903858 RepID=UPI0032500D02
MAGDDEDYGSARITIDLDEDGAVRDAAQLGAELERALSRSTRNIGRAIQENIARGLRGAASQVRIEPDLSRLESRLRAGVRSIRNLQVPVTADLRQLQRGLRRGAVTAISVPVTPDTRTFTRDLNRALRRLRAEVEVRGNTSNLVRQIQRELGRVRPPRITVEVDADVSRIQARLRSLNVPRIEATITLDVDRIEAQLRELAARRITIPINLGEPGGGGGGGGGLGEGLLGSLRSALGGGEALGAGFGAAAMGGIRGALTAAGPWGAIAAGVLAYATLVGKALMTGIEGVIEHDQLTGQLRAALGLTTTEANEVGRVVGQLYARGVVESVEDGTAAVQAALRAGLAAPDDLPGLEAISTSVADLGRLMEEDVGKVARAVGQMVRTGLVDNAAEGVDLLTKSVQQGGNVAEDLLDTFTEYPTQFRQLGLSAEEAFGLIQQGLAAGARDSDVIADALKEFSIEAAQGGKRVTDAFKAAHLDADRLTAAFAKGGPAARDALGEVFDKVQSIEDPLKRNQVAVGIFGTKAEDLAGALAALDLNTATKEMDGFGGAAKRAGDDLRANLGSKLTRISREFKQAFTGLFTGDFSQFADVGDAIRDALPDLKATGANIASSIQAGIVQYGPKIFQAVAKLGTQLGERVDLWGPLLLKLVVGAAAIPAVIGSLIATALGSVLVGIGKTLLPYLQQAWDAVVNFFTDTIPSFASDIGSALSDAFTSAFDSATGAVSSGVDAVVGFFTGLPGRIASGGSSLGSMIGGWFTGAFETAKGAVSAGIDAVVGFFTALPGRIVAGLLALPGLLVEAFTSAVAYLIIGLLTVVAGIVYVFTELPQKIGNALLSLGSFLVNAFITGVAVVTGWLATGVAAVVAFFAALPRRIASAASSLGSSLLRVFTSAFSSASSRTQAWVSQAVGFFRALPGRVGSALSSLGSSLLRNFSSAFSTAQSRTTAFISSSVSFFRGLPGKIGSALSSLGSKIGGAFSSAAGSARRAVTGLINGIVALFKGLPGAIVSSMGNIGSKIIAKVKSGLPSSVRKYVPFAKGGIVLGPTHALIGEDGPEVVLPLSKPRRAMELAAKSGLLNMIAARTRALAAPAVSGDGGAAASSAAKSLGAALSGVAAFLDGIGEQVVAGMVAGIRDNQGQVTAAAQEMADQAVIGAKETLDIHSPSKVFQQIGKDTGAGFIKGLTGTAEEIKKTAESIASQITAAFKGKKSRVDDRLVALVRDGNTRLQKLAAQRDKIAARIAEAQKFATDTAASALQGFSLQNLAQGAGDGGLSTGTLTAGLQGAIDKVKKFTSQINNLARRGLRKDLLQQIIGLGPEQGAQLATTLSGATKDTLKRINGLQGQLTSATTALGRTSADILYDSGKDAAKGFLAGLKGQQTAIEKLMLDIAKGMQQAIRSALKIKSPSRVMMHLGDMTGAGFHLALLRRFRVVAADAGAAARSLADSVGGELSGLGRLTDGGTVTPLTRRRQPSAQDAVAALLHGRPRPGAGTTITNHFDIREVGDGHVTAQRVVSRLVQAAGL